MLPDGELIWIKSTRHIKEERRIEHLTCFGTVELKRFDSQTGIWHYRFYRHESDPGRTKAGEVFLSQYGMVFVVDDFHGDLTATAAPCYNTCTGDSRPDTIYIQRG